jgi:hypothetical protein
MISLGLLNPILAKANLAKIYATVQIDYMPLPKKSTIPAKKAATKVAKKTTKKVVESEIPMKVFTCQGCKKKFPDMGSYFYDKPSKKCMWCAKFPSRNITKT